MRKAVIQLETLSCPSCMQKIENAVKGVKGIHQDSVKILFNASKVRFDFDPDTVALTSIEKAIEDLGYPVVQSKIKSA